jgi:hypothetical protein
MRAIKVIAGVISFILALFPALLAWETLHCVGRSRLHDSVILSIASAVAACAFVFIVAGIFLIQGRNAPMPTKTRILIGVGAAAIILLPVASLYLLRANSMTQLQVMERELRFIDDTVAGGR